MNRGRKMRKVDVAWFALGVACAAHAGAQTQPATVPTVVAQALTFEPSLFGRPRFFDKLPSTWPSALTPAGARFVGGAVIGDSSFLRVTVAVFEFPNGADTRDAIRSLVTRAGYKLTPPFRPTEGGFVSTAAETDADRYCKGASMVTFGVIDSTQSPRAISVNVIDGEMALQNCAPRRNPMMDHRPPITIPPLTPPSGVSSIGGTGSSWGDAAGTVTSILRTTIPADSILTHYTRQLVAGGWRAEGKPGIGDGVAVQRFSLREGDQSWSAALIILTAGDRRDVSIQFTLAQ